MGTRGSDGHSSERTCQPWWLCPFLKTQHISSVSHAPKIQGSELPTCHTRFSPAGLGIQQSLQPSARTPRPARSAVLAQAVVEDWRVAGIRGGIPAPIQFGQSTLTPQRRVLGSSQNHSHTLQQLPSALGIPSHFPTRRWFWECQIGGSPAMS